LLKKLQKNHKNHIKEFAGKKPTRKVLRFKL